MKPRLGVSHPQLSTTTRAAILRPPLFISSFLCACILCGSPDARDASSQVCDVFYHGFIDVYVFVWHSQRTKGTRAEYDTSGSNRLFRAILGVHVCHPVLYVQVWRTYWLCGESLLLCVTLQVKSGMLLVRRVDSLTFLCTPNNDFSW